MKVNIVYNNTETAKAILRCLKYVIGNSEAALNPFKNPYKKSQSLEMAEKSDFLIVESFIDGLPKGFQFAKIIKKKVLLLFYTGELEIEEEGAFSLSLPFKLNRLSDKIKELMAQPAPGIEEYEKLEERFPELRERKDHHR